MKRLLFIILLTVAGTSALYGQTGSQKLSLTVTTGYAQQDLKWSIAGNLAGESPNIYSELQWKKTGGQPVAAALEWNVWDKLSLMADYSHTFISTGTVTDNDYNGDNRTNRTYNELFNADKGHLRDWSIGTGYKLIDKNRFYLNAYAGYGVSTQSLYILDRTGNFPDLNSTYKANWKGPFVKTAAGFGINNKLKLSAALTYNQVNYNAAADWNLIQNFQHPVSYRHIAKGFGINWDLRLKYTLYKHLAVQADGCYYLWQTGKGMDELFLSNGETNETQLNKVDRTGYSFTAGMTFTF
ncbi:hypothetical protein [Mucilaginibacter sp.]|uniref:hypothetical protein n=1 Tax=Mucilaginibacter sp. TaxID=1882438 RepID=UPI00262D3C36|nr:hypothetical protein [Mucilaginibacter sp.]MDB5126867.1 hypothetical protein [Mucilaginibacter sp.]